jgi:uncharacterized protein (TIGR02391 family)
LLSGAGLPAIRLYNLRHSHATLLMADGVHPKVVQERLGHSKYLDQAVQRVSKLSKSGEALMMEAFKEDAPKIQLTPCITTTERDEQRGYRFLFAGAAVGIRNPRGHEAVVADDLETCLSHLSFATMLLRRLDRAEHERKKESAGVTTAASSS